MEKYALSSEYIREKFSQSYQSYPDILALLFTSNPITYKSLNEKVIKASERIHPDAHAVVIDCSDKVDYVIAILAAIHLKKTYVPLNPCWPKQRKDLIINELISTGFTIFDYTSKQLKSNKRNLNRFQYADQVMYILFTSGSTGIPKGVMVSYDNFRNYLDHLEKEPIQLAPGQPILQNNGFNFDLSLLTTLWPLTLGASVILPKDNRDPVECIETIKNHNISLLHASPSMLSLILAQKAFQSCHSIKTVMGGGEAWGVETLKKLYQTHPKVEFLNLYGPTETTIHITSWRSKEASLDKVVPIGEVVSNNIIKVVDPRLKELPEGETGELLVIGKSVALGYVNTNLDKNGFIDYQGQPAYLTGDMGYQLKGLFYYQGRLDNQVKIRGFRVQLEEIEHYLEKNSSVDQAVVVLDDNNKLKKLVAFVKLAENQPFKEEELRKNLVDLVPKYMIPHVIIQVPHIPLNASSKADKSALLESYRQRETSVSVVHDENKCVHIWSKLLNFTDVGIDSHFFGSGGDSLMTLAVVEEVLEHYGIEISVVDVYKHPTPYLLNQHIQGLLKKDHSYA